jgi:hypothetical protein
MLTNLHTSLVEGANAAAEVAKRAQTRAENFMIVVVGDAAARKISLFQSLRDRGAGLLCFLRLGFPSRCAAAFNGVVILVMLLTEYTQPTSC